jgi:hypothetical protein
MGELAIVSVVIGIPLLVGFALGYGVRELISRHRHRRGA